mmetsp:Transcript_14830/g.42084  ORF Transcript_14830/g.42084 Transcript_14830/m.42084 type:complete len:207 (-) Transcript_14830:13-633(-)
MPIRHSGMASRDRSVTMRSSQAIKTPAPAPNANPSATATVGASRSWSFSSVSYSSRRKSLRSSTGSLATAFTSAPAENALASPLVIKSASFVSSRTASSASHMLLVSALSLPPLSSSTLTKLGPARHVAIPQSGGRVSALAAAMVISSLGSMVRATLARAIRSLWPRRARAVQAAKRSNRCSSGSPADVRSPAMKKRVFSAPQSQR